MKEEPIKVSNYLKDMGKVVISDRSNTIFKMDNASIARNMPDRPAMMPPTMTPAMETSGLVLPASNSG